MDITLLLKAAIMGIVEGLTEFLPISSTGHLILAGALLGFDDDKAKVFDIAIQTGAILAVIIVYWQKVGETLSGLVSQPFGFTSAHKFTLNVLIAFVPAVVLGLLFGKYIKAHLFTPVVVASAFIVGGLIILWVEKRAARYPSGTTPLSPRGDNPPNAQGRTDSNDTLELQNSAAAFDPPCEVWGAREARGGSNTPAVTVETMTPGLALKLGLVQCLAMIPGTSRSGATIIGGMLLGLSRKAATDFSFYLAIPTLIGAGAYSLYKERALLSMADSPMFAVGLLFSFLSAWVCVRWLLKYIATHSFVVFAWYRIAFGLVVLATSYTGMVKWAA
jgi:undecaprenyl-diphosphatase